MKAISLVDLGNVLLTMSTAAIKQRDAAINPATAETLFRLGVVFHEGAERCLKEADAAVKREYGEDY